MTDSSSSGSSKQASAPAESIHQQTAILQKNIFMTDSSSSGSSMQASALAESIHQQTAILQKIAVSLETLTNHFNVPASTKKSQSIDRTRSSTIVELPRPVMLRFNWINVEALDVQRHALTAKVYLEATWRWDALLPDGEDLYAVESTLLDPNSFDDMWTPSIQFLNAMGELTVNMEEIAASPIYSKQLGFPCVSWRTVVYGEFSQKFDFAKFPYDSQDFILKIGTGQLATEMIFTQHPKALSRAFCDDFTLGDSWNFAFDGSVDGVQVLKHLPGAMGVRPCVASRIRAERKPGYWVFNVLLMQFIIVTLNFSIFAFSYESLGDRLGIVMTLVLTAVAFKLLLAEQLPDVSYMTILDKYVVMGIILLTVMALECCCLFLFIDDMTNTEHVHKVDQIFGKALLISWLIGNAMYFNFWQELMGACCNVSSSHRLVDSIQTKKTM